jgi:hypothetical protein
MSVHLSDTHPEAEQFQILLIRQASAAKRISRVRSLSQTVIRLARRAISRTNPMLTDREVNQRFLACNYGQDISGNLCNITTNIMKDFDLLSAIKPVAKVLDKLSVPYYISGSVASSAYGMPRSTLDVDIVADLKFWHVKPLVSMLESSCYIDSKMVSDAIQNHSSFNIIHLETMLKVDIFIVKNTVYDREAFERRKKELLDEQQQASEFYLASPEDIILNKLDWYRLGEGVSERQWKDVIGVIKVQGNSLDRSYLRYWASELGLSDLLDQAFSETAFNE